MPFGPLELFLILLIVAMLFGVGKLPEVLGGVGKGIKEFRKAATMDDDDNTTVVTTPPASVNSVNSVNSTNNTVERTDVA